MALHAANSMRYGGNPLRLFSGVTSVVGGARRDNFDGLGAKLNYFAGEHTVSGVTDRSSKPDGARHPVAFFPARKDGGLGSRNECNVTFTLGSLNLAEGRNIDGTTTITFSLADAQLELVVSATGSTSITFTADGAGAGALFADGTTSITFTVDTITLGAVSSGTGEATITFSASSTSTAIGHLEGDISPFTELSPESLATAVWEQIIDSGYQAQEIMRLLASVTAGKSTGGPGSPVFRDLADTKDRLTGTADADGNRSAATYDTSE